ERFHADWKPDTKWGWQQNRAIVGHNYKIAWNLTRCGHYYDFLASTFHDDGFDEESKKYSARAKRCYDKAKALGDRMSEVGLDRDYRKIRFRTTESGQPFIEGAYAQQAGHAQAGYHAFELNYLAHIYMRVYASKLGSVDDNFVLFFRPDTEGGMTSINVLPD